MTTVNVSVTVDSTGHIVCSPDPVPVSGANALINFQLQSSGYAFASTNPVVVPSPANQFPYGPWCPSSSQACLFDANTDSNSYKYVVHLVNLSDSQPLSVDPVIENGK
ncbi:MAG: hypothetical protein U1F53_03005 [Burkholderiaceae bacterium]